MEMVSKFFRGVYICLYIFEDEEGFTIGININIYRVRLVEGKIQQEYEYSLFKRTIILPYYSDVLFCFFLVEVKSMTFVILDEAL